MGVSLSILNGGIFNHDDLHIVLSILQGDYEVASSNGRNQESFYHILVILGQNPYGPPYTLLLMKGHMLLRPDEGTRGDGEYMDTDSSSTDDDSSDGDYSLSGNQ